MNSEYKASSNKKKKKMKKHTGNLFRKNQEPKDKMSLLNYFYR